jgi:xanthine dehydrogenase accessory factor
MMSKTLGDFLQDLPRPAVMCTLVKVVGSAPQEPGARMWVSKSGFQGTLGGGELERRILEDARGMLKQNQQQVTLKEYALCRDMGQCCGGRVQVFFEPVARRRRVTLFGAGHIGRATAEVLCGMPFDIRVVDARATWAMPEAFHEGVEVHCEEPDAFARAQVWSDDDAVCIFTHSHDLDLRLTRYFLRQEVGYLGLIGSAHKATTFLMRLKEHDSALPKQTWEDLWDAKMHCPIGKSYGSKNPKVIAVSIASELLEEWKPAQAGVLRPAEQE